MLAVFGFVTVLGIFALSVAKKRVDRLGELPTRIDKYFENVY
jgi:hypothetical protein